MMMAAKAGHVPVAKALLAHSADVAAEDDQGRSSLVLAVEASKPEAVRLLLLAHADINLPNAEGWTPIIIAAYRGDHNLVRKYVPRRPLIFIAVRSSMPHSISLPRP